MIWLNLLVGLVRVRARESFTYSVVMYGYSKCSDEKRGESGVAFFGLAFVLCFGFRSKGWKYSYTRVYIPHFCLSLGIFYLFCFSCFFSSSSPSSLSSL